uniref:Uncharacterized protein n=1 Tax=Proboscia inermis TaxID=420281 RepID=A0A7S0BVH5_9STRA
MSTKMEMVHWNHGPFHGCVCSRCARSGIFLAPFVRWEFLLLCGVLFLLGTVAQSATIACALAAPFGGYGTGILALVPKLSNSKRIGSKDSLLIHCRARHQWPIEHGTHEHIFIVEAANDVRRADVDRHTHNFVPASRKEKWAQAFHTEWDGGYQSSTYN